MRYVLGVLGVILVAFIAIWFVTRPRGVEEEQGLQQINISDRAEPGTSAVLTAQGAVVGQDDRRSIRVSISQEERRLEILTGYEDAVQQAYTFPNTPDAYETFLIAIDQKGFTNEQIFLSDRDVRGICPLGVQYFFEFKEFAQPISNLWISSCSSNRGTFGGNTRIIKELFEEQIPDFNDKIADVDLTP